MHPRLLLAGLMLPLSGILPASAQTTFTWIVAGPDSAFGNTLNWVGGSVPPVSGTSILRWSQSPGTTEVVALPGGAVAFNAFHFETYPFSSFTSTSYRFSTPGTTTITLTNGLTKVAPAGSPSADVNPGYVVFDPGINLVLGAAQTWNLNGVVVEGSVTAASGAAKLTYAPTYPGFLVSPFYRNGTLTLKSANNFAGGLEATNAAIIVQHASALNASALTFNRVDLELGVNLTLTSPLFLSDQLGVLSLETGPGPFTFTQAGTTTLQGNAKLIGSNSTVFSGRIGEAVTAPGSRLTIEGNITLSGDNSTGAYTGGTMVNPRGFLLFGQAASVPATGTVNADAGGYAGALFTTGVQAALVNRLDAAGFLGTLGLDSVSRSAPQTFAEPLNLSALTAFRGLGSNSAAIFSGALTLGPGQDYKFGGGGGILSATSALNNAPAKLVLNSPFEFTGSPYLTLYLRGANTYTGGTQVNHGALIFDAPAALPATGAISFVPDSGFGYAGYTENLGLTPNQFLARFNAATLTPADVVGIDSANPASPRTITDFIDLSLGGTKFVPYYLGTSTRVTLAGPLRAAGSSMFLAGINGGHLTVNSPFESSVAYLILGVSGESGTVQLNAANTLAGGTEIRSGTVLIGHGQAFGQGIVDFTSSGTTLAASSNVVVPNFINAYSAFDLILGQASSTANLTLAGGLFGRDITYVGGGQLTISGPGSFDTLDINAAGSGGVTFAGAGADHPTLRLNSGTLTFAAPYSAVDGLEGGPGTQVILNAGATLFLYGIPGEGSMDTTFSGVFSGPGAIVHDDYITYTLSGASTYTGGTTMSGGGGIDFGASTALGTGPVTIQDYGARFRPVVAGINIPNAITLLNDPLTDYGYTLDLFGAHDFQLSGVISGDAGITKYDANTVRLSGNNTFAGGIEIQGGTVEFAHNNAAGTGMLWFDPAYSGGTPLPNRAVFTTAAPLLHGLGGYDASSVVQLAPLSTLTIQQHADSRFPGAITSTGVNGASLVKTGFGVLTLAGANTYSGGTSANGGGLVFDAAAALPSLGSLRVGAAGYLGLGDSAVSVATFLGRFDKPLTLGSIGFDHDLFGAPFTVTTPVDLTGFAASARLGSATHALLQPGATVTPQGASYRFGGGGGTLTLLSALVNGAGPRALEAESPSTAPLTLRLATASGGNTYTGPTSAVHSAIIFATGSLSPGTTLVPGTGGYIGTEDPAVNGDNAAMAAYVGRFATGTTTGVIGFDSVAGASTTRVISAAIDLSGFSGTPYLGTASSVDYATAGVRLTGTITPAGNVYRFAGYKSGFLEVASALSGARSVVIGDPAAPAYFFDRLTGAYASVLLSGANTYTGTTTLHGGHLQLGSSAALGSGALVVQGPSFPSGLLSEAYDSYARLSATSTLALTNAVTLNSTLALYGGSQLTLSGIVSGAGGLWIDDYATLRLSGTNTFAGGIYVARGTVELLSNAAAAGGRIAFGTSGEGGVSFLSANPTIAGLESTDSSALVRLGIGTTLTINQTFNSTFRGYIVDTDFASPTAGARIVKSGTGTLRLESDGRDLSGMQDSGSGPYISADVQQGTLIIGSDSNRATGTGNTRISGGTLVLDHAEIQYGLIAVSGRLAGTGYIEGGNPVIGSGMTIAPGWSGTSSNAVGQLEFTELTLGSGGVYEWNLQLSGPAWHSDAVHITSDDTLYVTATPASPFVIRLIGLQADGSVGGASGPLSATQGYSWLLFSTESISGFNPDRFVIDSSQFFSGFGPGTGTFSVALAGAPTMFGDTAIMLTFAPVPEPSTWVMLASGAAVLAYRLRRRRR